MSLYAIFGSALAAGSNAAQLLQANPVSNTNQITPVAPAPIPPAPAAASGFKFSPFEQADPGMGPLAWAFFALSLAMLIGAIYVLTTLRKRYKGVNNIAYRQYTRWGEIFVTIGAIGLFLCVLRFPIWPTAIPNVSGPFEYGGQRIWIYLMFLFYIGYAAWAYYDFTRNYPPKIAAWQARQAKRQYDSAAIRRHGITTTPKGSPTGVKRRARR